MKRSDLFPYLLLTILLITGATLPAPAQLTGRQLEKGAHETYQKAYETTDREAQARLFEKAAEQYEAAAEAYHQENNQNKAREMQGWARAARSNAVIRKTGHLNFTGPGFKQLSRPGPLTELGFAADFTFSRQVDRDYFPVSTFDEIRKAIYTDEIQIEKLMETLGGEFFPGTFSGESDFSQPEWRPGPGYGLTANWSPLPIVGFQLTVLHSRSSVIATFPITVIGFTGGEVRTERGSIRTGWQEWRLEGGGQWFFTTSQLRPYLGAGAQWARIVGWSTEVTMGGQNIALSGKENKSRLNGYALVGLDFRPVPRLAFGGALVWTGGLQDSPAGSRTAFSSRLSVRWCFR